MRSPPRDPLRHALHRHLRPAVRVREPGLASPKARTRRAFVPHPRREVRQRSGL